MLYNNGIIFRRRETVGCRKRVLRKVEIVSIGEKPRDGRKTINRSKKLRGAKAKGASRRGLLFIVLFVRMHHSR